MRPVEDWFLDWLAVHRVRFEGIGLPDPMGGPDKETQEEEALRADVLYEGWQAHFDREGITEEDAIEASIRLQARKSYPLDHFHDLLAIAKALASGRHRGTVESPEATARRLSRECPECDGQGVAVRFRQRSHPVGGAVYLHCVCPLGRHLKADGRTFGGSPCLDLAAYPWLRGESGDRYRQESSASPPARELTAAGMTRKEFWWRTGHPVPNIPAK